MGKGNGLIASKNQLTPREKEILLLVASGKSSLSISSSLCISENTVLTHMKSIHRKLDVKTRQHAVAKAVSMGIIFFSL